MTARELIAALVDEHRTIRQRLDDVAADPLVKQFPQSAPARRAQIVAPWKKEVDGRIQQWQHSELPQLISERAAARDLGLQKIRRGLRPDFKPPADRPLPSDVTDPRLRELELAARRQKSLESKLDALLASQERAVQLRLMELSPTEDLAGRVQRHRTAAAVDRRDADPRQVLGTFDFAGYAQDREMLGVLLHSRANGGDERARLAATQFQAIDEKLLDLAGLPRETAGAGEEKTVADVADILGRLDDAATGPVMRELDGLMDGLGRALTRAGDAELAGAAKG